MQRRSMVFAVATVLVALGVLFYSGPGHVAIRGSGGDVCVAAFLVFVLGALFPNSRMAHRGLIAFAVCGGAELIQLLEIPIASTPIGQLTLGSHFDRLDFLFYGLGVAIAIAVGRLAGSQTKDSPSS